VPKCKFDIFSHDMSETPSGNANPSLMLRFEISNLAADGGKRNVQLAPSRGEAPGFNRGDEIFHCFQTIHLLTFREGDHLFTCAVGLLLVSERRFESHGGKKTRLEDDRQGVRGIRSHGSYASCFCRHDGPQSPKCGNRRRERGSIRIDIRDGEFSQIILIAGLTGCLAAGNGGVGECVNIRANAKNFANGAAVCGLQQECALLRVEFSLQDESPLERISFALGAMVEADADFDPLERKFPALRLKPNGHSGACSERRTEKVVRIGTGRHLADAIRAADRKFGGADMANQPAMTGRIACDDNFADLGCVFL
jgi:hypothetical protein